MDRYFKSSHQQAKHLRQEKKNNLPESQENQKVILDDIQSKMDSTQHKNPSEEDYILLNWAYKKTKNIVNNVVIDLTTT
ncbi:22845_t:CDS:2 [Rhizophagus irregularis]|nr:22845_t:CDS:2 [Rhizophagus irregularis]